MREFFSSGTFSPSRLSWHDRVVLKGQRELNHEEMS